MVSPALVDDIRLFGGASARERIDYLLAAVQKQAQADGVVFSPEEIRILRSFFRKKDLKAVHLEHSSLVSKAGALLKAAYENYCAQFGGKNKMRGEDLGPYGDFVSGDHELGCFMQIVYGEALVDRENFPSLRKLSDWFKRR
jgi:hypothetical protein